jgi:4-amino-4-deoxy-L-arabinose transferase-like glycosyltransferase
MNQSVTFRRLELCLLILLLVLVNLSGIFYPILRNDDPALYASIAKHMVLSGNWINLMFDNIDWLDKPHLPFWLTALSFKILGINSFAYILPGFLFHLLGAYFTYRLTLKLYSSVDIALIAVLIYLSSLHLLISSIDVRAEAYLLGEIMGACYYWYLYNERFSIKYLIMGSIFTALALMTKGTFVLVSITSGLIFVWAYNGELINLIKPKWILAFILSLVFTYPEVYALYHQFDLHPDKIVFGHTHVSGIRWFFWDSQFGRFFANGPITVNHVQDFHYLFFVHTFLWAFLPWSIIFGMSLWDNIQKNNLDRANKANVWYLLGSFFPTFILFSMTKFQLDHYTNIIMPFAAIMCADWLSKFGQESLPSKTHPLFYIQFGIAYLLIILALVLYGLIFPFMLLIILPVITGLLIYFWSKDILIKLLAYSVIAMSIAFLFMMQINKIVAQYDLGYQVANYLKEQPQYPIIDYNVNSLSLEFNAKNRYKREHEQFYNAPPPYYLLIKTNDIKTINLPPAIILTHVRATTVDKVMANLLNMPKLQQDLVDYSLVLVK